MRDQEIRHGEERGVHDPRGPGEEQHAPLGPGGGHQHHADAVDQLAADVHRLGPGRGQGRRIHMYICYVPMHILGFDSFSFLPRT